jgi:hypothetical protein
LRKYLIAALAALTAMAMTSVAEAQTGATLKGKLTPAKAGTKKKPKNSKLRLQVENQDTQATLSQLAITSPSTVKLSTKGLTRCDADVLEAQGPSACPRASRVGGGVARALLGVNGPNPQPLTFDVTAVVTGSRHLDFYLRAREIQTAVLATGTISGRTLTIRVPDAAQQPLTGVWAGLVSLDTTIGGKKGKNYLLGSVGCKKRKHTLKAKFTFRDNGVRPARTVNASGSSRCS